MDDHGGGRGRRAESGLAIAVRLVLVVVAAVVLMVGAMGVFIAVAIGLGGLDFDVDLGGPGKGKASQQLPVAVTPTSALRDGSVVRVRSSAFDAGEIVGVAVCLTTAATERRGVDACDTSSGARYAVDENGRLDATYAVPRAISVGGTELDCAAKAGGCMVVAASASDYDLSGGQVVTFSPPTGPPRPPPAHRAPTDRLPIVAWQRGPVAAGSELTATVRGFQPNEPVLVAICGPDFARSADVTACTSEDTSAALTAIMMRDVSEVRERADASGTFTTTLDVPATAKPAFASRSLRCVDKPGTCSLVITAAADTKRSAVLPLTVTR